MITSLLRLYQLFSCRMKSFVTCCGLSLLVNCISHFLNHYLCFLFSDSISESNPRVIDDSRARKLASDLKHCSYYETCATYGLNVERVFQDGTT